MIRIVPLLIIGLLCSCNTSKENKEVNFQQLLPEKYNRDNIIESENYNIWGTNIVKGKDGKFHAIYSRWPKQRGHMAWVTHSEIAHAVSDNLTGPYEFKNMLLPSRGNSYWDGSTTHNPHVLEHNGKYYLYYMGNKGSGYWQNTADTIMPSPKNNEWWVNRNNQRIGLAITDNINGEWKRFNKPLIDIDSSRKMVSTPVVSIRPDGKFLMTYKYVEEADNKRGGRVIHVTALSDAPEGPFVDTGIPFIVTEKSTFAIDDHVEWFQDGKYYCLGKDHDGSLTEYPRGSLVLFSSNEKGLDWQLAKNPLAIKAGELKWTDGTTIQCERTADMPKLYMENGIPKALIVAVLPKKSEVSFATIIPFENNK